MHEINRGVLRRR